MASLLDTIQQNQNQLAGQQAPLTDQTQQTQQLLTAKSGKATGASDTGISNLGEQAAVAGTQSQLNQVGQQIATQQQGQQIAATGQQQQQQQQMAQLGQASKFNTIQNTMRTQSLLNDLSREKGTLDLSKDQSRLEQTAFLLSMQDKKYTDQLQNIGQRRRLDNQANFQDQMQQVAFGDNLSLLQQKLGQGNILQANDRDFKRAMANISMDDAMQMAANEEQYLREKSGIEQGMTVQEAKIAASKANIQAQAQGLGGLVQGGVLAARAASNAPSSSSDTSTPDTTNLGDYNAPNTGNIS